LIANGKTSNLAGLSHITAFPLVPAEEPLKTQQMAPSHGGLHICGEGVYLSTLLLRELIVCWNKNHHSMSLKSKGDDSRSAVV